MSLTQENIAYLSQCAITAAREAGDLIASYSSKEVVVQRKSGGDNLASQVVTEVDLRSEAVIVRMLQPTLEQFNLALLTEESADDKARLEKDYFWCIDPLDGTLSFTEGVPGYAVSIALVSQAGEPLIGVVYNPLSGTLYSAIKGQGALRNNEPWSLPSSSSVTGKPLTIARDWSFTEQASYPQLIETLESVAKKSGLSGLQTLEKGGGVMNACWVLENPPACYFKLPKPNEGGGCLWDFAATACLFHEVGGIATDYYGQALDLNRPDSTFMNHRGVMFATDQSIVIELRKALDAIPGSLG